MRDTGKHISRVRTKTARALAKAHLKDDRVHNQIQRDAKLLVKRGMNGYRFIRVSDTTGGTIWCYGYTGNGIAVVVFDEQVNQHNGRIL